MNGLFQAGDDENANGKLCCILGRRFFSFAGFVFRHGIFSRSKMRWDEGPMAAWTERSTVPNTPLGGGPIDDLTAITSTFEWIASNEKNENGTFSATANWDEGSYSWRLEG